VRMSARSKIGFWDDTHPAAGTSWYWLGIQTRC
jgi:hypothetical protein